MEKKVFTDENFVEVLSDTRIVKDENWNWIQLKFKKIEEWKWELISDNVDKVKQIFLFNCNIKNLDWILNFTNLVVLDLSFTKIQKFPNLLNLTNLKKVYI